MNWWWGKLLAVSKINDLQKKWKNQGVVALHLQVVLPNVITLSLYQMCTFSKKQIKSKYLVYSEVVLDGVMVHQFGKRCICGMQWVDLAHRRQPLIKFLILFQRKSDYNLDIQELNIFNFYCCIDKDILRPQDKIRSRTQNELVI